MSEAIERHNARLGGRAQRALQVFIWLVVMGPPAFVLLRLVFRIRVTGAERLRAVDGPSIFAAQHFHEWDSLAVWCAAVWPHALTRWHLVPYPFVGGPWVATRLRRSVAWVLGLPALARGAGAANQSAYALARRLAASGPRPPAFVICPTGAVGRDREPRLHAGVAYLAECSPRFALYPVALGGFRELEARRVLALRRPEIAIHIGSPIAVSELPPAPHFADEVLGRIGAAWQLLSTDSVPAGEGARR